MSIEPRARDVRVRNGPYFLSSFDKLMAPVIVSWVPDAQALFWLAPNTPSPLTASKVVGWAGPNVSPLLFCRDDFAKPLGYLELNLMPHQKRSFWLGHCIIDPDHRGSGLGQLMVDMMLVDAFGNRHARDVHLIVFPENKAATRCYRRAGFLDAGEQLKHFTTTGRHHTMLRMIVDRRRYEENRRHRAEG